MKWLFGLAASLSAIGFLFNKKSSQSHSQGLLYFSELEQIVSESLQEYGLAAIEHTLEESDGCYLCSHQDEISLEIAGHSYSHTIEKQEIYKTGVMITHILSPIGYSRGTVFSLN